MNSYLADCVRGFSIIIIIIIIIITSSYELERLVHTWPLLTMDNTTSNFSSVTPWRIRIFLITGISLIFRFLWPCIVSKVWRERKNQQDATIRCLLSASVSTCFGHYYAHLQENKDRVTALVLLDVVGGGCGALRCRMRAVLHIQQNQGSNTVFVLLKMGIMMPETCWDRIW